MAAALDKGKISSFQLALLLFTLVTATAVIFVPAITYHGAKQDGWMSLLLPATFFGLAVVWTSVTLAARFPGENLIEFLPKVLGKLPGKTVGFLFILWFVYINAIIIREFGDLVLSAFMPETPLLVFNMIVVALGASASRNGIEVIARANLFIFPLFIMAVLLIIFLSVGEMNLANLQPVFEGGVKGIIRGGIVPNAFRGEVVLLLMFLPMLNNPGTGFRAAAFSVIVMGIFLAGITITGVTVFGGLTGHQVFPFLSLAEYVSVGDFLERLEALVIVLWVAGITIKVAIFYHAGVLATASWFGLRDYRPVVLPLGIIMVVWSETIFESSRELVYFLDAISAPYMYTFELLLPLLILAVAWIRKKGGQPNAAKTSAGGS